MGGGLAALHMQLWFCMFRCYAGHSMGGGLAAVAAGSHADTVTTAFLMDPVDWNLGSNRVDSQYLSGCDTSHLSHSVWHHTVTDSHTSRDGSHSWTVGLTVTPINLLLTV